MLLFDGAGVLISLAVWIFCIIDVITTPEDRVRNLPRPLWLLVVILLLDLGSIAWLVAGRPWNGKGTRVQSGRASAGAASKPTSPDDDEEFLAGLRARADEQRRRAQEADAERRRSEEEQPPS
jgi:hypothetical protein